MILLLESIFLRPSTWNFLKTLLLKFNSWLVWFRKFKELLLFISGRKLFKTFSFVLSSFCFNINGCFIFLIGYSFLIVLRLLFFKILLEEEGRVISEFFRIDDSLKIKLRISFLWTVFFGIFLWLLYEYSSSGSLWLTWKVSVSSSFSEKW